MNLLCRTCLAHEDKMESLFSKRLIDKERIEICRMILLCTGLEILENDKFANTICSSCLKSIINAYKYRKKCWKSQKVLHKSSESVGNERPNDTDVNERNEIDPLEGLEIAVDCSTSEHKENNTSHRVENIRRKRPKEFNNVELSQSAQLEELIVATVTNHKRYKNMDKFIKTINTPSISSTEIKQYACTLCNEIYESVGPLRKHLLVKHNIQVLKSFECQTCSKTFVDEKYYNKHVQTHNQQEPVFGKHVCQICGKHFKFESPLLDHLRRHYGEKRLKCDLCDFRTISSYELKVHKRSHTGEKPYVCHICGNSYKSSSHRGAHVKAAHTEGRPYECAICFKNYKSPRVYREHMTIHNPKNEIKCEICSREFNYRKNMLVHMKQHGEKTFKCTVCEKAFYQKQSCQLHMKKVHDLKMGKPLKTF